MKRFGEVPKAREIKCPRCEHVELYPNQSFFTTTCRDCGARFRVTYSFINYQGR